MTSEPQPIARWKVAFVLALLGLGLLLGYALRAVFIPILIAFALAYLLNPAVKGLERLRLGRTAAILTLFAGVTLVAGSLAALVVPPATVELRNLYVMTFQGEPYADVNTNGLCDPGEKILEDINGNGLHDRSYLERVAGWARRALRTWNERHPDQAIRPEALLAKLREAAQGNLSRITGGVAWAADQVFGLVASGLSGLLAILSFVLLVPLYLFGFLSIFDRVHPAAISLCPPSERERLASVLHRMDVALAGFFRGQVTCSLIKGTVVAIGFSIAGTPYGLLLGILYGLFSIVPYAGALFVFPLAMALTTIDAGGVDAGRLLGTAASVGTGELVEGALLVPLIFGKETGLHPLVLLVCIFVLGQLLGLFGVLAAVPLTVVGKILAEAYLLPIVQEVTQGPAAPPPAPAPPPPADAPSAR
jgi:predicted PurR-regulated permease PerM